MKKKFDSVKMMREIRDKLSKEFNKLTFAEQKKIIKQKVKTKKSLTTKNF